jgi:hypothetical protein
MCEKCLNEKIKSIYRPFQIGLDARHLCEPCYKKLDEIVAKEMNIFFQTERPSENVNKD